MSPDPSKFSDLLDQGFDHIAKGKNDLANRAFQDLVAHYEAASPPLGEADKAAVAQAHNQLGLARLSAGAMAAALDYFQAARALVPSTPGLEANLGLALYNLGRFSEAEVVIKNLLANQPGNPQGLFHLGRVTMKLERPGEAAKIFQQLVDQAPTRFDALLELGLSLEGAGEGDAAKEKFDQVRQLDPDLYQQYYKAAEGFKENHIIPAARESLVRASRILPNDPIAHHAVGVFFQELGDKDQAEAFLKASLKISPSPQSYGQLAALYEKSNALNDAWANAQMGLQMFPDDPYLHLTMARCERRAKKYGQALARLTKLQKTNTDAVVKTQMDFLLGWLYDQQGELDNAFGCYARAKKEAVASMPPGSADRAAKEVSLKYIRDMRALDLSKLPAFPEAPRPGGPAGLAFLVGFPRSGTTLLNQILDSHPNLVGIEEKPTIPGPATLLLQTEKGYPWALEDLDREVVEKLRESYYQRIENFADYDAGSIVIDKLPLNLIHLPLIWAMFPDAKIILALRHPLGSVLSCFMHNFKLNNAMANMFSLDDITGLYQNVMGLWQHLRDARDFPFHAVKYEDVVSDIEGEARRICEFLGVEWSDEMLKYAQHARAKGLINTPSYHQVVQPLYSESLERWRRYETYLKPYGDRVAPFCDLFGYKL